MKAVVLGWVAWFLKKDLVLVLFITGVFLEVTNSLQIPKILLAIVIPRVLVPKGMVLKGEAGGGGLLLLLLLLLKGRAGHCPLLRGWGLGGGPQPLLGVQGGIVIMIMIIKIIIIIICEELVPAGLDPLLIRRGRGGSSDTWGIIFHFLPVIIVIFNLIIIVIIIQMVAVIVIICGLVCMDMISKGSGSRGEGRRPGE